MKFTHERLYREGFVVGHQLRFENGVMLKTRCTVFTREQKAALDDEMMAVVGAIILGKMEFRVPGELPAPKDVSDRVQENVNSPSQKSKSNRCEGPTTP